MSSDVAPKPEVSTKETSEGLGSMAMAILMRIVKYVVEGVIVVLAALYLSKQKGLPMSNKSIMDALMLGLVAAAVFVLLDTFVPEVGSAARKGSGFVIGANIAGGF